MGTEYLTAHLDISLENGGLFSLESFHAPLSSQLLLLDCSVPTKRGGNLGVPLLLRREGEGGCCLLDFGHTGGCCFQSNQEKSGDQRK